MISDSVFKVLQSLLKLRRWLADAEQGPQSLPVGENIVIVVLLTAAVFIHGEFLFSSQ